MKRFICLILTLIFLSSSVFAVASPPEITAPCAILMERDTGKVLFEKDSHSKRPPASVTKIMTLLLVMEAIDSGAKTFEELVTVSEHAASMGGSQVFLEPGEQMSVNDMLKSTVISSGNDSAVALAEHIAGSEDGFVDMMNEKAKELGMNDTTFKNCTGLDTEGHVTSAHDIAIMSRELLKHEKIKDYTTIWMDTIRNGAFGLSNTNKLIKTYKGITGLKTGSTSVAKFCLSATAEREGMELISVIMAAPSGKERFADAAKLLDYGFANYSRYNAVNDTELAPLPVILGECKAVTLDYGEAPVVLVEKQKMSNVSTAFEIPENVKAPVENGQKIGTLKIMCDGFSLSEIPIIAKEQVKRIGVGGIFAQFIANIFMK